MSSEIARPINQRPFSRTTVIVLALVCGVLHFALLVMQAAENPIRTVSGRVVNDAGEPVVMKTESRSLKLTSD